MMLDPAFVEDSGMKGRACSWASLLAHCWSCGNTMWGEDGTGKSSSSKANKESDAN